MSLVTETGVTLAQGGDAAAFTRLVDASKSAVSSIAFAIVKDPLASQELAQDVYLEAWDGLGRPRRR